MTDADIVHASTVFDQKSELFCESHDEGFNPVSVTE